MRVFRCVPIACLLQTLHLGGSIAYAKSFTAGKHYTALTFSQEQVCFYLKCREDLLLSISVALLQQGVQSSFTQTNTFGLT